MTLTVTLPWPPKDLSPNARAHWRKHARFVKAYRNTCWALSYQSMVKVTWEGDIHVWLDYYPPNRARRDLDNLIAASKAALDGLADALKVDDSRFRLHTHLHHDQVRVGGSLVVRLTQGPDG